MQSLPRNVAIVSLFLLLFAAASVQAATKGRIMTNGKVTLFKKGQALTTYTEQGPVDENALIACDGGCMVKMQGISLNATDQTRFALKEADDAVNLFVATGKLYFLVTDLGQRFAFYSPHRSYVKTEGFIAPAATNSTVKGFIRVNDKATEIGMDTGSMVVQTQDGPQTINPGQSIVLAMADVPDNDQNSGGANAAGGENTSGSGGGNGAAEDPEGFSWTSLTESPLVLGAGVAGGLVLGSVLLWDNADNDHGGPPSPPPPPVTPPPPRPRPPASPNR